MGKERPILFSTEMVNAILEGRKTQTRRVIDPQPVDDEFGIIRDCNIIGPEWYEPLVIDRDGFEVPGEEIYGVYDEYGEWGARCPYGSPGDMLYVKEGYEVTDFYHYNRTVQGFYIADNETEFSVNLDPDEWDRFIARKYPYRKTSGRFMYKSLARIWLRVKNVRVERINDISWNDVKAEGSDEQFMKLWNSINEKRGYGWDVNPWVWVVEFEKKERENGR